MHSQNESALCYAVRQNSRRPCRCQYSHWPTFTFDLHNVIDLTPESHLSVSTTPSEHSRSQRYSHWMHVNDEPYTYAEVARPDIANEIRPLNLQE